MSNRIITVSRQFGSGGHSIAAEAAKRLGVACYDKELVRQVSIKSGFDAGFIEEQGEYAKSRFEFIPPMQSGADAMKGMSVYDYLWYIEREVILGIADKGPCVIVGRCADFILKDRGDVANVFIYASPEYRAGRIRRLYGDSADTPAERIAEKDKKRRNYYKRYTGGEWGAAKNYGVCLNSGAIGEELCADIIVRLAE